jgi:hypothetical protein
VSSRLALLAILATLTGCAATAPVGYCTPAGMRTIATAGVSGTVGSINALPASGACGPLGVLRR